MVIKSSTRKRNVLLIVVDCLRADMCFSENKYIKTPSIDLLRENGTSFIKAICTSTTTTPSFASILTGNYSFIHTIRSLKGNKLSPALKTLPEILKKNGYKTYMEVTGPLIKETGIGKKVDFYNYREPKENFYTEWGNALIKKIKNRELKEPWFLLVHFWVLHSPRQVQLGAKGRNKYERAVSSFDTKLHELLNSLDDKNTLIILTGDHGENFPKNKLQKLKFLLEYAWNDKILGKTYFKRMGHGFQVYDYLINVPLIFMGPGIPSNKIISEQISHVDIMPTLLEYLNIKEELNISGKSFAKAFQNKKIEERPIYAEACGGSSPKKKWISGIRTPEYKFIFWPYNDKMLPELYDLKKDPLEKKNIINKKPEIAKKLKKRLIKMKKEGEETARKEEISKNEKEKIEERLRALGYID